MATSVNFCVQIVTMRLARHSVALIYCQLVLNDESTVLCSHGISTELYI
jgi:hypothetical protein